MAYKIIYLPSAANDILAIESHLHEFNAAAADTFTAEIRHLDESLKECPMMYQLCDDDFYFREVHLSYHYRLFFHVAEEIESIQIHRVIRSTRDTGEEFH